MHRKHIPWVLMAILAPGASRADAVAAAERALGRAEGRVEACLQSPNAASVCPPLLEAMKAAAEALGLAKATASKGSPAANPAPEPGSSPVVPGTAAAGLEAKISELIEGARKVQTQLDELRGMRAGLYDTMDKARDIAMGVNVGSPHGLEALEAAKAMPGTVTLITNGIRDAQAHADAVVNMGLELRRCTAAGAAQCKDREILYNEGRAALAEVKAKVAEVKDNVKGLRVAARNIAATEAGLNDQDRAAYRTFEEGLQSLPGARSLLGGDFVGLTASKEDALVALQFGRDIQEGLLGRNRVSFHMTAPLATGSKRATLFDNVNGLSEEGSFGFGYGMARSNPLGTGLYRAMLGATISRKNYKYLVADGNTVTEAKESLKPWRVGVEVEYALLSGQHSNTAHRVAVFHERKFKDGDPGILCPSATAPAVVGCQSGNIGAPKRIEGTTVSYAYHYRFGKKAIAPRLSYDTATKTSALDVPFYVLASRDKSTELNAGILFGWARKPGKDGAPSQSDFNFGVFVGAPFGLLSGGGLSSR